MQIKDFVLGGGVLWGKKDRDEKEANSKDLYP